MLYINIHTHHSLNVKDILEVQNLFHTQLDVAEANTKRLFTLGVHPWHSNEIEIREVNSIIQKAGCYRNIIAFGECGIDKSRNLSLEKQMEIFKIHISISEEKMKPLIIHCVRAFDEIIMLRKQIKAIQPWIIHGFNKGPEMAKQLIKLGFHLSFNKYLINNEIKMRTVFSLIPDGLYFLETDEDDISEIKNIYKHAATIRQTSTEGLSLALKSSFEKCFNIKINDWLQ